MIAELLVVGLIEFGLAWTKNGAHRAFVVSEEEKKNRASEFVDGKIDRLLSIAAFKDKGMVIPETFIEQQYNKRLIREFNGDRKLFRDVLRSNGQSQLEFRKDLEEEIIYSHMLSPRRHGPLILVCVAWAPKWAGDRDEPLRWCTSRARFWDVGPQICPTDPEMGSRLPILASLEAGSVFHSSEARMG